MIDKEFKRIAVKSAQLQKLAEEECKPEHIKFKDLSLWLKILVIYASFSIVWTTTVWIDVLIIAIWG